MKKNTSAVIDFLYYLLFAGLLSGIAVFYFSYSLGISELTRTHGLVLLLSVTLLSFIKELNKRQRLYAIISIIILLIFLFISIGREKCLHFVQSVLYLPFNKDINLMEENVPAEFIWIFLIAAAACILLFLLEKKFLFKIGLAFALIVWLIYAMFSKQHISEAEVALPLFYCVLVIIEWIQSTWKKQKNASSRQYILWLTPFLILYISLLCLMPAPEAPYSWQWVKRIYHNAEEKVTKYIENIMNGKNEDLDMGVTGFSEETGLFSEIRTEQKPLMNIKVKSNQNKSLYLAGKVYDSFEGLSWESLNRGTDFGKSFDSAETIYALELYSENSKGNYFRNIPVEVKYQFFHTNYLLAPSKTWVVTGKEKAKQYYQEGTDYLFYDKAGYGTEYSLQYCQLNMDREKISDFLQCDLEDNENIWEKTTAEYLGEKVTLEELYAYRENIRTLYVKNIEISPKTEEWLSVVTANAKTDVEKLYCIESALSGMEYNTKPGKLPETVIDATSFLDYFLLEKKEGYCSYFATAFVLLAQAEGFPARYVQGFCIPVGNENETIIYSNTAHAWPEVYIDGKGWIPFEPTPGYETYCYTSWKIDTDKKAAVSETAEYKVPEDMSSEEEITNASEEELIEDQEEQSRWLSYIWKILLLIIITGIFIFTADRISEKHREKRRNIGEKYRIAFFQNLHIIAMLGYEKEETETYHELTERIRSSDADESEIPVEFIETYESVLYGTKEISEQDLESCLAQHEKLLIKLKQYMGRKFLFCKIKLYIIRYR